MASGRAACHCRQHLTCVWPLVKDEHPQTVMHHGFCRAGSNFVSLNIDRAVMFGGTQTDHLASGECVQFGVRVRVAVGVMVGGLIFYRGV